MEASQGADSGLETELDNESNESSMSSGSAGIESGPTPTKEEGGSGSSPPSYRQHHPFNTLPPPPPRQELPESSRLVGANLAGTSESSTSNFASTSAQGTGGPGASFGGSGVPFGAARGGSGCPVLPGGSSGTQGGFGGLGTSEDNSQPMLPSSAAEDGYLGDCSSDGGNEKNFPLPANWSNKYSRHSLPPSPLQQVVDISPPQPSIPSPPLLSTNPSSPRESMDLGATPLGSNPYIPAYGYQEKPQTNLRTKIKSSGFRSKYNSHVGNDWSRIKMSIAEKKLRIAASTNNSEQVEQLCQNGANVRCFDEHQRSPLHFAAAMGYSEVAEILLKHGADPNQKDKLGNTALHLAACTNHVPVVTLLLRAGTDITTIDNNGRTPMQLAQAKLKILQRSSSTQKEMSQVKDEVSGVLEMMREYLKKVLQSRDTDRPGGTEEVYSQLINSFSQRLSLHTSHSDLSNDLGNLLQSLGTLNLNTP